jgi:septum formation protein
MNRLILASQSKARIDMLRSAGLSFEIIPAHLNEESLLAKAQQRGTLPAQYLAQQKALTIAAQNPDALVIGSDQILEFRGEILSKAPDSETAIARLKTMAGQAHTLTSAVSVALNNEILWSAQDEAHLTMYKQTDIFWENYRSRAGEALTSSVGGYWIEDIGAWLFECIDGNYFTVLGMPLLPLLYYLRAQQNIGWQA